MTIETVHRAPTDGSGITECCGRTPFELSHDDRLTAIDSVVTCGRPWVGELSDARLRLYRRIDRMAYEAKCRIDGIEPRPEPTVFDELAELVGEHVHAVVEAWTPIYNGLAQGAALER